MNTELLIISTGYIISIVITLGFGLFVFLSGAARNIRVPFFLMTLAVAVFESSFLLGTNTKDPELARKIFMFNLADIFIVIFNAHWILEVLNKAQERKSDLKAIYAAGLILFAFFLFFPDSFLKTPEPKIYFPNYYEAGDLYILMVAYFFAVTAYFYYHLISSYLKGDAAVKNRVKYFLLALTLGYGLGSAAFPLVFDVRLDPILSMLTGLYTIPLAYGVIKHQLMDINVVIRRSFFYAVSIVLASAAIITVSFLNSWFAERAAMPIWIIPLIVSAAAFFIGHFVWQKSTEAERMKYDFLTIAAHKLRTPLTHIKWRAQELAKILAGSYEKDAAEGILAGADELIDLTNKLLRALKEETGEYFYNTKFLDIAELAAYVVHKNEGAAKAKNLSVVFETENNLPAVLADENSISAAIQAILDNAITYTPEGGKIAIKISSAGGEIVLTVKDAGIGISAEELPFVFDKFYRGERAKLIDTEGLGLNLFIVKNIVERHGGKIYARSDGPNRGSSFMVRLKTARQ